MKVEILERNRLLDDFFKIDVVKLKFKKFSGKWSNTVRRLNFERGESVGVLIYVRDKDVFVLVRQFRFSVYEAGEEGWLDEIAAGILDDPSPLTCAKRECIEETGYEISDFDEVGSIFVTPGASTERIHLFIGYCNSEDKKYIGGGLEEENEDLLIIELPRREAYQKLLNGEFNDGKTIIALQQFFLRNPELIK